METPNPVRELPEILRPVRAEMEQVGAILRGEVEQEAESLRGMLAYVARFAGKRLRPAMVLLSGHTAGRVTGDHLRIAAVVEMIHTATLVHDDILDDASARRNLMTANQKYGNEMAVLVGDQIFARAFVLVNSIPTRLASEVLTRVTTVICTGEMLQVHHRFDFSISEDLYLRIIREKTASLYAAACELGAAFAGADRAGREALHRYGLDVGTAFQIVDDCLDLSGDEEVVGKTLGTDITKGKMTLPLVHFFRTAPEPRRRAVLELLEHEGERQDKKRTVRAELEEQGSIAYAQERAVETVEGAKHHLARFPASPARDALVELADYVVQRTL
jgi:octaprenyl-diphosphate synthase